MKTNYGARLVQAVDGTPFWPALLCAIACQETAIYWHKSIDTASTASILSACVYDASGEKPDWPRSAFPRNTAAFRAAYGDAFTNMLIAEANAARALRSLGPAEWVYKGYGIFQYDLQFVKDDESYFRDKKWYDFDECLARAMKELKRKYAALNDVWETVRAYNGSGERARKYMRHVQAFNDFCKPTWDETPVASPPTV